MHSNSAVSVVLQDLKPERHPTSKCHTMECLCNNQTWRILRNQPTPRNPYRRNKKGPSNRSGTESPLSWDGTVTVTALGLRAAVLVLQAMVSVLKAVVSVLRAMVSVLKAMASVLKAMVSVLTVSESAGKTKSSTLSESAEAASDKRSSASTLEQRHWHWAHSSERIRLVLRTSKHHPGQHRPTHVAQSARGSF